MKDPIISRTIIRPRITFQFEHGAITCRPLRRALDGNVLEQIGEDEFRKALWVSEVFVDPEHRGRGFGSEMLSWLCAWADEEDRALALVSIPMQDDEEDTFVTRYDLYKRFYWKFDFIHYQDGHCYRLPSQRHIFTPQICKVCGEKIWHNTASYHSRPHKPKNTML